MCEPLRRADGARIYPNGTRIPAADLVAHRRRGSGDDCACKREQHPKSGWPPPHETMADAANAPENRPWPRNWTDEERPERIRDANYLALFMTLGASFIPLAWTMAIVAAGLCVVALKANPGGRYADRFLSGLMLLVSTGVAIVSAVYIGIPDI